MGRRGPGTAEQEVTQGWEHRQGCKGPGAWPSLCRLYIVVNKSLYFFEHLGASVKDNTSQNKAQMNKNAPTSFCAVTLLQRSPLFSGLAEKTPTAMRRESKQHPHCAPPNAALHGERSS